MRILNEESSGKPAKTFALLLNKQEAQTLVEIAEAAYQSNKRKRSFLLWKKKLEDNLMCY